MKDRLNRRNYTLVEMLVVMAIIAILIGVGAGGYTAARRWISQSRTESLLAKLKIALESYKNDKGYYPQPHTDPSNPAVNFKLDVNLKDYTGSIPADTDHLQPRNNMNKFVDYGKVQTDESIKVEENDYNQYYPKDGWNAPSVTETISGNEYSWGAIKYRCPGIVNPTSFDLYSAGNDRVFAAHPDVDTEDDVYVNL